MRNLILILFVFSFVSTYAQNTNDLLNLLISNKVISQHQADSLKADAAAKQQEDDAKIKKFQLALGAPFQLSGYTQIRFQKFEQAGKSSEEDIRRARLNLKGNITPYWSYSTMLDFTVPQKLVDAYTEFKPYDFLILTAGQMKLPFSLESTSRSDKLDVIDYSYAVNHYVSRSTDVIGDNSGNDIGVQISGSLIDYNKGKLIDYKIGVFDGAGINVTTDNNENKDVVGRAVIHPLRGLDLGYSYYNGFGNFVYNKVLGNYKRNRHGFDLNFENEIFSFKTEYIRGTDASQTGEGYYVQAGYYILPHKLQLAAKYDNFDPNLDVIGDRKTSYTFVLNYYISKISKIQAGYQIQKEETNEINNNITVVQLQIGF